MRSKFLWAALALVAVLVITTAASATTRGLITGKQIAPHAINSKHLVNHTIQAHDLSRKAIASFSVNHAKSADDAAWADNASSAGMADWATDAEHATNATTAANANALGGIAASSYVRRDCSENGAVVKAFAWIADGAVSTTTMSTAGVYGYNCSGGAVLARRIDIGKYEVQWVGFGAGIAFATPEEVTGSSTFSMNSAAINKIDWGHFYVQIFNQNGPTNGSFSIWSP